MRRSLSLLSALVAFMLISSADAAFLADRHKARGTVCTACHKASPSSKPTKAECLACHGTYKKLRDRTKNKEINPHGTHLGDVECSSCHQGHKKGVLPCVECHGDAFNKDLPVP